MFARFAGLKHAHFVGIGGAGMSGIAEVLNQYELKVSGCDQSFSETTQRLMRIGVPVRRGHAEEHLEGVDLVVASSAISDDNPEIVAARRRGITVVRRSEMLAELMRLKYGIAIAGTHGKTTTTSMVGTVLTELKQDPTVIVGGRLRVTGTGARLGHSDFLIAEADEFDRSFLRLQPIVALITNIDVDHLDTYADYAEIQAAFVEFARKVPFFGQVIVCLDNHGVQDILPALSDRRVITYGISPQADLAAVDLAPDGEGGMRFGVVSSKRGRLGEIHLPMPGRHNVQNALGTIAVALAVGLDFSEIARALAGFGGVHRRFERLGSCRGAEVVDDYAHHPTEVDATLRAARMAFPSRRIQAIFQPHLFSRTRDMHREFGQALLAADVAWVTDIYPSREQPIEGITGEMVVQAARDSGHRNVRYLPDVGQLKHAVYDSAQSGDLILTLGAGDIYRLAEELVAEDDESLKTVDGPSGSQVASGGGA